MLKVMALLYISRLTGKHYIYRSSNLKPVQCVHTRKVLQEAQESKTRKSRHGVLIVMYICVLENVSKHIILE